jgi:branched-chain amino acid transport system ATP-binding protein
MPELLRINSINVYYGKVQVLWDVSLEVNKGEIVTVVGANGAGKTTLMRTISGLIRPSTGTIIFKNKRIDNVPPHQIVELGITHIPERRHIFPKMTVLENLEMGAYTKRARNFISDTLEQVFNLFPILYERRKQKAWSLSGGEQQMLAIARGLMSRPELLLMDEPSLGLAPKLVSQIFDLVVQLCNQGVTILLTEQNVHQALEISNTSYVLENGKVVLQGPSKELINNDYVKKAYLGI